MKFNLVALALAAMATVASAGETVTVYACASSLATSAGVAGPTVKSTGVVTAPTSTGSPIAFVTGAASMNAVPALGLMVAGGVALLL